MKFLSAILALTPSLIATALAQNSSCGCVPNTTFTESSYQNEMVATYISVWEGNYSRFDEVLSPDVHYYQDSFAGLGQLNISNGPELLAFMKHSRTGWSSFQFVQNYKFGSGYKIALRWRLEGVIQNATFHYPTATAAPGTPIAYNGTDVYFFNPCTGLIDEVDSAADYIDYYEGLGIKTLTLV